MNDQDERHEKLKKLFADLPNYSDPRKALKHVERPSLSPKGLLSPAEQWRSLCWMVDMAQAQGANALRALAKALARMIQADAFRALFLDAREHRHAGGRVEDLLWDPNLPITPTGENLYQLLTIRKRADRIKLGGTAIIANLWQSARLARSFQNIGRGAPWGQWQQTSQHHAHVWHPWPLVWVHQGNHSIVTGILSGVGTLQCDASYDANRLLLAVTTDGESWKGTAGQVLGPVESLPMAGIFEIGKRLVDMNVKAPRNKSRPR